MSDLMIFGTGWAAGVLSLAVWHGVHVWLEGRGLRRKMAKVAPWDEGEDSPFLTNTGRKLAFILGCAIMAWVGIGLFLQGVIILFRFVN